MNKQQKVYNREFERVLELSEYDLDYSEMNEQLNDLTRLAANVAGSEISLINLIDSYAQWSVSRHGIEIESLPRGESVCQYTILEDEHLEIKNLNNDDRLKDKSYVKGDPHLKYYFGIPLKTDQGNNLGALCVIDRNEKELTPEKIELLKIIADEIVTRLQNTKKLNELQVKINELISTHRNLSHDIRGPISGIIGLSELIKEQGLESGNDLSSIMELNDLIQMSGQSVLELADEILENNNKQQEPGRDEFNLLTFKEKLKQLYSPQALTKEIDLNFEYDHKNEELTFSKNKLLQITGNLISNAIKFTPQKGSVHINMTHKKVKEGSRLIIHVSDTGVGIDDAQLKLIKNGNSKSTDGTSGERGFGLGLPLVQHLVETSGGTIQIDSELGKGTTFKVELPR
jgi:signal transduction histidine kinase